MAYSPRRNLNRDFGPDYTYYLRSATGHAMAVMTDPDLEHIFTHLRNTVKPGTALMLGCRPMFLHYFLPVADRVTHVTGQDISQANLDAVMEFFYAQAGNPQFDKLLEADYIRLKCFADWIAKHYQMRISGAALLGRLMKACERDDTSVDLVQGYMFDLDDLVGERQYDNIILLYAIWAGNEGQVAELFRVAKRHLAPGGRLIVFDMINFDQDDLEGDFEEDPAETEKCPDLIELTLEILKAAMLAAGFAESNISARQVAPTLPDGEEVTQGYEYLELTADNG